MESNQELFKQAILDAKAVRETAMAAARTTLAEHFEPMVKSMFKETVEGIEEEVEEGSDMEEAKMHDEAKEMHDEAKKMHDEAKHADMEESTLDEILAELDALSEEDSADIEEGHVKSDGYDGKAAKGETGYDEKAKVSHGDHKLHEEVDEEVEEAKKDDEEDDKDAEKDDKAEEAGEDLTHDIEGAEDVDMDGADEQEVVDITVGELKDIIRDVFMTLQGGGDMGPALDADTDLATDLGTGGEEEVEAGEISLDEILAELEAEEGKVEEGAAAGEIPGGQIDPKAANVYKVETELNEAVKTIKALKAELNEINLFNAKLMYVNKIFKAKNLSESQKTKVINAFDRATSVKEVENTFKTLSESLNGDAKKSSLKESVGFASKPIGNAPARPIVEADAFVTRWQQLAGIKK